MSYSHGYPHYPHSYAQWEADNYCISIYPVYKYCISCTQDIQATCKSIFRTEKNTAGKKLRAFACSIFYIFYKLERAEICRLVLDKKQVVRFWFSSVERMEFQGGGYCRSFPKCR